MTDSRRQLVINEARTWLGTPFHWNARVKSQPDKKGGVDCANFIAAVYEACAIFNAEDWGFFGRDWHFNTSEEHYLFRLRRHATQLPFGTESTPGCIVLAKVGASKVFSHSGIVTIWPSVITARPDAGVSETDATFDTLWSGWEKVFFDPFTFKPEPINA